MDGRDPEGVLLSAGESDPAAARLPIGVFDSGVGGLTVLRAIRALLPSESLLYLGDTARVPYGTKSAASVRRYAEQATRHLVERGVKLLVVACNTASAVALPELQAAYAPLPVLGVVEPGARAAVERSRSRRIAVLATEGTVRRGAYGRAIRSLAPAAVVDEIACSLFVALAEEGWTEGEIVDATARRYLCGLASRAATERPDCVVLGCTHFPLVAHAIARVLGPEVAIVDSADTTADAVRKTLDARGLLRLASAPGALHLLATDDPARFARVGRTFLGLPIPEPAVERIDLH